MKKEYISGCLKGYAKSDAVRLHMPGHKGKGAGILKKAYALDITELSFSDNLACPSGVIAKAEKDIAKLLGAKRSRILTGGSTLGIFAMVHAVKERGSKLLVQRTAHKSIFNALELLGIEPVILNDNFSQDGIGCSTFENDYLFDLNDSDLIGALLTSPDYFGRALNLKQIKNRLNKNGKLLLIDGAHGGHFAFENRQIYAGSYADIWVDGAHKTFQTLTQGAILNVNNPSLIEGIEEGLSVFSTTSPSYLIMASVESGVKRYCDLKEKNYKEFTLAKQKLTEGIVDLGLSVLPCDDILKLTLCLNGKADGNKIGELLEENGIYAELACKNHILFMLSFAFSLTDAERIIEALKKAEYKQAINNNVAFPSLSRAMDYNLARKAKTEEIPLTKASGRICACNAGVFPPCYPVILAGEVFDNNAIELLSAPNTFGVLEKNGEKTVKVVKG